MNTLFPVTSQMMRYALQGRAPFEWICRGRVCYEPTNYTPTPTDGTSEIAEQLCAHLRGIDLALTGGGGGDPGDFLAQEDEFHILLEGGSDALLLEM